MKARRVGVGLLLAACGMPAADDPPSNVLTSTMLASDTVDGGLDAEADAGDQDYVFLFTDDERARRHRKLRENIRDLEIENPERKEALQKCKDSLDSYARAPKLQPVAAPAAPSNNSSFLDVWSTRVDQWMAKATAYFDAPEATDPGRNRPIRAKSTARIGAAPGRPAPTLAPSQVVELAPDGSSNTASDVPLIPSERYVYIHTDEEISELERRLQTLETERDRLDAEVSACNESLVTERALRRSQGAMGWQPVSTATE